MTARRIYLAGPDVFLPDAPAAARHATECLEAMSERLEAMRSTPLPVGEFRALEAALVAVRAASEVISAVRPAASARQSDPLRDPPGAIRRSTP